MEEDRQVVTTDSGELLTSEEEKTLLSIARASIEAVFEGARYVADPGSASVNLRRPSGAFVTLRTGEDLRGCIGSIQPVSPLCVAVADNAVHAAFRDPRFPPLTRHELPQVTIEISVLGPVEPVTDYGSIMVGRDGLIVRSGNHGGLLLPQVASEYGWDRETFLSQTCVKAGLRPDAWRSGRCQVERFRAHVFGEP